MYSITECTRRQKLRTRINRNGKMKRSLITIMFFTDSVTQINGSYNKSNKKS